VVLVDVAIVDAAAVTGGIGVDLNENFPFALHRAFQFSPCFFPIINGLRNTYKLLYLYTHIKLHRKEWK
jgi:hypothetical protein